MRCSLYFQPFAKASFCPTRISSAFSQHRPIVSPGRRSRPSAHRPLQSAARFSFDHSEAYKELAHPVQKGKFPAVFCDSVCKDVSLSICTRREVGLLRCPNNEEQLVLMACERHHGHCKCSLVVFQFDSGYQSRLIHSISFCTAFAQLLR